MIADALLRFSALVTPHLAASTPLPTSPAEENPDLVTPGVWGFTVIAVITVVVILLVIDMVRRIRRVRYREEIRQKLDAEQAANAATGREPHEG